MRGFRKSFFLRLIFTNLLVITIVLLLILIIQNSLFLNKYKEDLVRGHGQTLQYLGDIIDNEILGLFRLSNGISVDGDLSYFQLMEKPHNAYRAVLKLKNYYSANIFVDQITLSFYQHPLLYTSEGSYKKVNYLSENFDSDDYQAALEMYTLLQEEKTPGILNAKNAVYFSHQFPLFAIEGMGVILYRVKKNTLGHLLRFDVKGQSQYNMIFHGNDNLLVSSSPVNKEWIPLIRKELNTIQGNQYHGTMVLEDDDYLIQFRRSDLSDMSYLSLLSQRTALAPFYHSRLSLLYSFAVIYVLSIVLSLFFSVKNYDPFKKIKMLMLKGADGQHIQNEVLWMENTIQSMNRIIEDQKPAFRNNTMNRLIQNKYETLNQFISDMEQSGLFLPFKFFGFFIIQVEKASDKKGLIDLVSSMAFDHLKIIRKDSIQARQVLFLYNTSLPSEELNALFHQVFEALKTQSSLNLTMGVGSSGDRMESVKNSLSEAFSAMEYKFVIGKNKIIFYSSLLEDKDFERPLSAAELDSISFSIYSGDLEKTSQVIDGIIAFHKIRNLSLLNAKTLTYQIANRVLRTIDEILDKKGLPLSLSSDIQQHIYLGSVDEMTESIHLILKNLESLLNQSKIQRSGLMAAKVKEMISSEFRDPRLSVQDIADKLEVSVSYLSRVFKKNEGKTILAFITEKRINLAKKMLINSPLPVKEIMENIGYMDLSSFTRKFKSITGSTPGYFRKNSIPPDLSPKEHTGPGGHGEK